MANEETEAQTVEQPPAANDPKPEKNEKKKSKGTKEKKPRKPKTAAHPPYFQMIKEALLALNEKSGSSPYAIAKYMEEKHKTVLPENFRKILALQLKNSATKGKLIKIRASYKLSDAAIKEKSKEKNTRTTIIATRSSSSRPKRSVNKPEAAKKKVGSRKAKPKQPKSIKSPAAKKARKSN